MYKRQGSGTIPAKKLLELVRLLPDEEIKFKLLDNHWIQITCGRKTYKLVGMSKDNFPALPPFPHALVKIPAKLVSGLVAKTSFCLLYTSLLVPTPSGQQVPISELATIHQGNGASFIYRENNSRYIGVQFSIEGRDLARAVNEAQKAVQSSVSLPQGYRLDWGGEYSERCV